MNKFVVEVFDRRHFQNLCCAVLASVIVFFIQKIKKFVLIFAFVHIVAKIGKITCFCFNYNYKYNYNLKFSNTVIQVQVIVIQLQF